MRRKRKVIEFLKKYETGTLCTFDNITLPAFHELRENFSDRTIKILELIEEGNKIIAFWTFYGKETCSGLVSNYSKKTISFRGSHVFYFQLDEIVFVISTLSSQLIRNHLKNIIEAQPDELETFKEYLQTLVALNIN